MLARWSAVCQVQFDAKCLMNPVVASFLDEIGVPFELHYSINALGNPIFLARNGANSWKSPGANYFMRMGIGQPDLARALVAGAPTGARGNERLVLG
jgi:hypothetical protein